MIKKIKRFFAATPKQKVAAVISLKEVFLSADRDKAKQVFFSAKNKKVRKILQRGKLKKTTEPLLAAINMLKNQNV